MGRGAGASMGECAAAYMQECAGACMLRLFGSSYYVRFPWSVRCLNLTFLMTPASLDFPFLPGPFRVPALAPCFTVAAPWGWRCDTAGGVEKLSFACRNLKNLEMGKVAKVHFMKNTTQHREQVWLMPAEQTVYQTNTFCKLWHKLLSCLITQTV